jgi:TonB family protein
MFDSMVYIQKEKSLVRWLFSFPAAILLQVGIVGGFMFYSIFTPDRLPPPQLMLQGLYKGAIRVELPRTGPPPKRHAEAPPKQTEPAKGLTAPPDVPNDISKNDGVRPVSDVPSDIPYIPGVPQWGPNTGPPGVGFPTAAPLERPILRVAEMISVPQVVRRVEPRYPPAAAAMGLSGRVVLEAIVDESGRVESVRVVSSTNSLFEQAALEAVRQWRYSAPVGQGGQRVACYMTVVISFALR